MKTDISVVPKCKYRINGVAWMIVWIKSKYTNSIKAEVEVLCAVRKIRGSDYKPMINNGRKDIMFKFYKKDIATFIETPEFKKYCNKKHNVFNI